MFSLAHMIINDQRFLTGLSNSIMVTAKGLANNQACKYPTQQIIAIFTTTQLTSSNHYR
jgi:hypothetical protein